MNSAMTLVHAGVGSRKLRANLPSYSARPQPSACGPVLPPRNAKPVNEKTMSVGTLQSIPRSSHMPAFYRLLRRNWLAASHGLRSNGLSSERRRRRARMLSKHAPIAIATVLFIGCGGGGSSKPDGGGSGGSIGIGGASGSGAPGGATGANPTGSLVLQGNQVALLDLGPPCTNEEGATSDRWCAVFGPSVVTAGQAALFVINVTKAAAGASITCASSDANCIKLTDSFGENDSHPALFQGDTLVYYDVLTGTPS